MFLESEKETPGHKDQDEENVIVTFGGEEVENIDLIIDKNRYNAPTKIKMKFNGKYSEFTEVI